MNILVTGATGRIGSRIVPRLLQRGDCVRVLVRQPERAQTLREHGAEIAVGDLLQPETLNQAVADIDAIVHLAAFFRGATEEQTRAVNLEGTVSLAQAALQANVRRFIFASTNLVYGTDIGRAFNEEDSPKPAGPYPETKAAAEQALMQLHYTRGLDLRILRLAFVYGDKDPHLSEGMQWFRNWNPQQRIHMVHHADVAQAVMLATDTQEIGGQIYNVADNEPAPAEQIMKLFGEPVGEDAAHRPIDTAWLQIADTAKIREKLGFRPIYPSLRNAVEANAL
ncbi:NAD-dependent epimerase/dehydratase family protein [Paenibacillus alkalitolerans]|uniref:NAD-dependent epimerase/dehydratase family protein n=1 Tax=Paenibacillus alkalitolerans TaxID=2799335 RepID=UPI0018F3D69C|nr:NAD(P)-dependent oxidoreductase [Paenibacillus alkalitolerans]